MKRGPFGTKLGGSEFGDSSHPHREAPWGTSTGIMCNTCGKPIRFGREAHRSGNTFYAGKWKIDCPGRFCTTEHHISEAEARALQAAMASGDPRKVCLMLRKLNRWIDPYKDLDNLRA